MASLDFDRLLKLRLVVARFGEMDVARWWNTNGLLGHKGAILLRRGLPKTHRFAQARAVFSVARARCNEVFHPPGCVTLWNLPAALEDQFDARWHGWLDEADAWEAFFEGLQHPPAEGLAHWLLQLGLLAEPDAEELSRLRRSAEGRAVPISQAMAVDDRLFTLLAGGFSRGEEGRLAVPYAPVDHG